mmetsp:Transcript_40003/g.96524  ORF Transcript_40003/g.96524 Transcript_40003/m.96524 type:complete len:417 (-) Transcript_40003:864-2114(-)
MTKEKTGSNNKQEDERAARAIKDADVLLLVTGAGFSADSGLAVYNDIGKVEAYQLRNLDYCDVSQPKWIEKEPALFYGFWGQSFNDYRSTKPHGGFQILQRWRDDKNCPQNKVVSEIRSKVQHKYHLLRPFDDDETRFLAPYKLDHEDPSQIAGAFYAFTSNVDAHHYDVFGAHEIHDCHGNIELWQCANRDCDSGIWRASRDHKFVVDKEWMLAPEQIDPTLNETEIEDKEGEDKETNSSGPAKIGQAKGSGEKRQNPLQYLPPGLDQKGWKDIGPTGNWPRCGHCDSLARPAILMFGDFGFKYDMSQNKRWELWLAAVMDLVARKSEKEGIKLKVCVLEIGCGMNVPTCRNLSETIVEKVVSRGGDPTLIRVNPDYPEAPKESVSENHIISIRSRGLEAIRRIDEVYKTLNQES